MITFTAEQEVRFFQDYKDGFVNGEELLLQYKRMMHFFLQRMNTRPYHYADAFQDACICLIQCADTWNPNKGRFSTYLLSQMRAITTDYHRKYRRDLLVKSLEEMREQEKFDIPIMDKELLDFESNLKRAISVLDEREKKIIYLYFFKEIDLNTIGTYLNISKGSIGYIFHRAIRKMKDAYESRSVYISLGIDLSDI